MKKPTTLHEVAGSLHDNVMLFGISLPVWDLPACPLPPFYSMLISKGTPKFFAEAEAQKINFEINFEFMGGEGGGLEKSRV